LLRAYFFIFAVLAGGWMLIDAQSVQQIWASATAAIAPLASYSAPAQNASVSAPASSTAETYAAPTPAVAESAPVIRRLPPAHRMKRLSRNRRIARPRTPTGTRKRRMHV
jgi:hypothetical protein